MATKKECDRCGFQWDPSETVGGFGEQRGDSQLCTVQIRLPKDEGNFRRPALTKKVELCQNCARHIAKELERKGRKES